MTLVHGSQSQLQLLFCNMACRGVPAVSSTMDSDLYATFAKARADFSECNVLCTPMPLAGRLQVS